MITRLFIRLVSLLVPASQREQWREEWLAELAAQPRSFDRRVLGTWRDAVALRTSTPSGPAFAKAPAGKPRNPGTSGTPEPRDLVFSGVTEDLRLSLRLALRDRGHSALTIAVVALSVGLTTAVLSIAYAVFLKPWPIHEPERVAFVFRNNPSGFWGARLNEHTPDYNVVAQNPAVESVAGFTQFYPEITIDGATTRIAGEFVTAAYFDVTGIAPLLGRTFHPDEDSPTNTELGIVISHRLWQRAFGGRGDVVGHQVQFEGQTATVIGVLGPQFHGLSSVYEYRDWWMLSRPYGRVNGLGGTVIRLAPGASVTQATMGFAAYGQYVNELERTNGFGSFVPSGKPVFEVIPADEMRIPMAPAEVAVPIRLMWALVTVVGMVLLIAVTSIACLGVARGIDRESEVATRRVLGVSNWRLGRQLVIEQSLLMIAGGLLACVVAWNLIALAIRIVPERYLISAELDWRLFAIAVGVSLATGVVVSLAPLRHALRIDLLQALSGSSATSARPSSRMALLSLTPQVTLAAILLVTAGVHVKALLALEAADLGYTLDGRTVMELNTSGGMMTDASITKEERLAMLVRLSRTVAAWPDVTAGLIDSLPLNGQLSLGNLASSETTVLANTANAVPYVRRHASPTAFDALNIRLLTGRSFTLREYQLQSPVAVVSHSFAQRLWPGANPVGQRFVTHRGDGPPADSTWVEVIGTVPDLSPLQTWNEAASAIYTVAPPPLRLNLVLAGVSDPTVLNRIRDEIQTIDRTLRVTSIRTMSAVADDLLRPRRTAAAVLTATGLAGLALACIGLYAHVALSVARRRREFGIRSALGASAGTLVMHIVRDHGRIALLGAVLGLGGAIATLRISSRVVRDVPTSDVTTFIVVPLVLVGVCLLACVLPARRAGTVDPVSTLKA